MGLISIYIFIIVTICVLVCFSVSQITNCFFHCFNTYFPLRSKGKTILLNMFRVSFGSLVLILRLSSIVL